jgi:Na+/proline symporter
MEKKLNKKRVKKNKKPKNVLVITTIYVICFSVIAGVFAYTRINKYEDIT